MRAEEKKARNSNQNTLCFTRQSKSSIQNALFKHCQQDLGRISKQHGLYNNWAMQICLPTFMRVVIAVPEAEIALLWSIRVSSKPCRMQAGIAATRLIIHALCLPVAAVQALIDPSRRNIVLWQLPFACFLFQLMYSADAKSVHIDK